VSSNSEKNSARPTRLEDVGRRMDDEIEQFIAWFNDEVVPSIRNRSSRTLRKASEKLATLADHFDQNRRA
jgi:hypothetical protein